jgi:hypothetical protein
MSNAGLLRLAMLPSLTQLQLIDCPLVTEAGLRDLLGASGSITRVHLKNCRGSCFLRTQQLVQVLREQFPAREIHILWE